MRWVLTGLCAAVVVGRFLTGIDGEGGTDPKEPIHWERWYIDLAHLVVFSALGWSFALRFAARRFEVIEPFPVPLQDEADRMYGASRVFFWSAIGITAVEVVVALAARKFPTFTDLIVQLNLL